VKNFLRKKYASGSTRRRRATRISRAKIALGMASLRAETGMPSPPANAEAVQLGRDVLPRSDRD
jgi:hypothetical protein